MLQSECRRALLTVNSSKQQDDDVVIVIILLSSRQMYVRRAYDFGVIPGALGLDLAY
jgi:hypothetical protein